MLAEKLSIGNRKSKQISETLDYMKASDFSVITQEMCDKLIKRVDVGIYVQKGAVNYGKQSLKSQIYEIGFIDEFVDMSYKTFRERI